MINTQAGKAKRYQEYLKQGWWNLRHMDCEPYVTWEHLIDAVENSLQLSEAERIFNSDKEKK